MSPTPALRQKPASPVGKILAIDYGRARIGLATADALHGIAQPFSTLDRINRNEDMRRLRELIRDHHINFVLVGLPLRLDGTPGEMAQEAESFANRIRKQIRIPVEMVDERLTSWEAERQMEEQFGRRSKSSARASKKTSAGKVSVDSMAAAIILRDYLQRKSTAQEGPPQ